jgi:predicted metal-binding membrane protein
MFFDYRLMEARRMALLFAGGVMNLIWIAGLAGLVLLEKLAPRGDRLGHLIGAAMLAAGIWLWFGTLAG